MHVPRPPYWPTRPTAREAAAWAASSTGALLVHAAAVAVLLVDFDSGTPRPAASPLAAMTVELAPRPTAPMPKYTEMPPGPKQVEQPVRPKLPPPRRARFDPPPQVNPPPPDALAAKPDVQQPEPPAAAERTTAAPSSPAQERGQLQAPVEGASSGPADAAEQTWENRLLAHLQRYKRYPGSAQWRHQEDVVYLRFTIDRQGKVLNWNIEKSRGYAALDEEVNALIQRASPLPSPPEKLPGSTIERVVPVEFFLRKDYARAER